MAEVKMDGSHGGPLFNLGQLVTTPGALALLRGHGAVAFGLAMSEVELEVLQSTRAGQVVAAQRKLRMYRGAAQQSETAARIVAEMSRKLEELGDISDDEIKAYTKEKKRLETEVRRGKAQLQTLRRLLGVGEKG